MLTQLGRSAITSLLFLLLIVGFSGEPIFGVGANLIALLMVVDALLYRRELKVAGHLEVKRSLEDETLQVGERLRVRLVVRNPTAKRSGLVEVRERLPRGLLPIGGARWMIRLGPLQALQLDYEAEAREMGRKKIEGPILVLRDRWGLFWTSMHLSLQDEVRVLPTLSPSELLLLRRRQLVSPRMGEKVVMQRRLGSEFGGIRDYVPGDDHRLIAWKAMAKSPTHSPMTKELEEEVTLQVVVLLDNTKSLLEGPVGERKLDEVIKAILSLAEAAEREGDRFLLLYRDAGGVVKRAWGDWRSLAKEVHDLPCQQDRGLETLIEEAMRGVLRRSLFIIMSDAPYSTPLPTELLEGLGRLGHRTELLLLDTSDFLVLEGGAHRLEERSLALEFLKRREREHLAKLMEGIAGRGIRVSVCRRGEVVAKALETLYKAREEVAA